MKIYLFIALIFSSNLFGALTEKYANFDLATGSDDGTSEANAWKTVGSMVAGYAAGDRVNIKRTASRISGDVTLSTSSGATTPTYFRGYTTTIGDGGLFQSSGRWNMTGTGLTVEGIDIETSNTAGAMVVNDCSIAIRCLIVNTNASGEGLEVLDASATLCYAKCGTGGYSAIKIQRSTVTECFADANGAGRAVEVNVSSLDNRIINCVIDADGAIGIEADNSTGGRGTTIVGNTIYNSSNAIEVEAGGSIYPNLIARNTIYSATNGIVLKTTSNNFGIGVLVGNAMGDISTARISGFGDHEEISEVTLTADPFTDKASQDFSFNDTSGGGALLRAESHEFNGLMSSYPFRLWVAASFGGGSVNTAY